MAFYSTQHELYCGVDLHGRRMYTCVIDADGKTVFNKNLHCTPQDLRVALEPLRERDIALAVESTFNWYWLADACDALFGAKLTAERLCAWSNGLNTNRCLKQPAFAKKLSETSSRNATQQHG